MCRTWVKISDGVLLMTLLFWGLLRFLRLIVILAHFIYANFHTDITGEV